MVDTIRATRPARLADVQLVMVALIMWRSPFAGRRTGMTLADVAAFVLVTSHFIALGATRGTGGGSIWSWPRSVS